MFFFPETDILKLNTRGSKPLWINNLLKREREKEVYTCHSRMIKDRQEKKRGTAPREMTK